MRAWPVRPRETRNFFKKKTFPEIYFSLRFDAISLNRSCFPDSPAPPQLQANSGVGVAHGNHWQEVGHDHEGHIIPSTTNIESCKNRSRVDLLIGVCYPLSCTPPA